MATDAVRLVPIAPTGLRLESLGVAGNPLDNYSRDGVIPELQSRGIDVRFTPATPIELGQVAPQFAVLPGPYVVDLPDFDPGLTWTATTDNAGVQADIVGGELHLSYPTDFLGTVRVTIMAEAANGRTDKTSFDLHVGVGAVYGTLFNDLDRDGQRDEGEPLLVDWPDREPRARRFPSGSGRITVPTHFHPTKCVLPGWIGDFLG